MSSERVVNSKSGKMASKRTDVTSEGAQKSQNASKDALLSRSASSSIFSILFQLAQRLITFVFNQVLLRLTTPEIFGTATVQFDLLAGTIIFLTRDGIRGALLREDGSGDVTQEKQKSETGGSENKLSKERRSKLEQQKQALAALSWMPLFCGTALTAVLFPLYIYSTTEQTSGQRHFYPTLVLYAISVPIELYVEPWRVYILRELKFKVRARIEGIAVIVKAIVTLVTMYLANGSGHTISAGSSELPNSKPSLIAYGLGHLSFALTLLVLYLTDPCIPRIRYTPRVKETKHLNKKSKDIAVALSKQSVLKQFLTEGDKMILSRIAPLADQGGYGIADSYGSLIARIVFQPIEENIRILFGKKVSVSSEAQDSRLDEIRSFTCTLMTLLLKVNLLCGLIFVFIAPAYTTPLLSLLAPAFLRTSAPAVLQVHCVLLPLLGLNGVTEALLQSTASARQLGNATNLMLLWSFLFAGAAYTFTQAMGFVATGLVWANVINIGCRVIYNLAYTQKFLGERHCLKWREVLPSPSTIVTAMIASWLSRATSHRWQNSIWDLARHFGNGACLGVGYLIVVSFVERRHIEALLAQLKKSQ